MRDHAAYSAALSAAITKSKAIDGWVRLCEILVNVSIFYLAWPSLTAKTLVALFGAFIMFRASLNGAIHILWEPWGAAASLLQWKGSRTKALAQSNARIERRPPLPLSALDAEIASLRAEIRQAGEDFAACIPIAEKIDRLSKVRALLVEKARNESGQ